ncbi:MAG: hypothetical protein AB7L84_09155 [Acidimicrobiia bacterium]
MAVAPSTLDPAPVAGPERPARRRGRRYGALAGPLVALWTVRWLVGPELPPGDDVTGHLQRVDFALATLFGQGRWDGWFPGAMLGYQLHLFYGPGLALLVGAVRLAGLGLLSTAGALELCLVGAHLAVPWTAGRLARALGLGRPTAAAAGILALAASSPRGGGLEGAFTTGLAAQHVAVPLVLVALALTVEACGRRARPRRLALVVAALALTHPLSLVLLGVLAPVVLAVAWAVGVVDRPRARPLLDAAAWSAGLAACWWLPLVAHRDLRGPVTSWDLPGVAEHVRLLVTGGRGWRGVAGPVVAAGVVLTAVAGVVARRRDAVALALLPVGALVALHLAHGVLGLDDGLGRQLPNRGLAYVAVLSTPAAARALAGLTRAVPGGALVLAVLVALSALGGGPPPHAVRQRPTAELVQVAELLAREVPAGARFAFVGRAGPSGRLGVPAPERWLALAAGRPGLAPFGPEYAPGAGVAMDVLAPPPPGGEAAWAARLRDLAASHVVTADVGLARRLAALPGTDLVRAGPGLAVVALDAADGGEAGGVTDGPTGSPIPGRATGSPVPGGSTRVLVAADDEWVVEVDGGTARLAAPLALGWSPGWRVEVDGRSVPTWRAPDGRLAVDLPAGAHVVRVRFREAPAGPWGRLVSAATLGALGAGTVGRALRRSRGTPGRVVGSMEP